MDIDQLIEHSGPLGLHRAATSIRVLQFESDPSDAAPVQHELRKLGITVTAQRVGAREEFEHALDEFAPDIVLLDYKLPDFDGATALKFVREHHPEIPAVMVTGGAVKEEAVIELLKAGAADCVLKDNLARLAPAVRRALLREQGIRARKAAEKLVRKSELRYRRLFEAAQDGILMLDGQTGTIIDSNPFLTDHIGYSRDELLGKMLWEIDLFVDKEASKMAFIELEHHAYVRYENLTFRRNDGGTLEVEFVSNAYDVDGTRVYQCNIRDITDRRRVERALNESELRFRSMIENASDVISVIRPDGTFGYVSPAIYEAGGYEPKELIGHNLSEVVDPSDLAAAQSALATIIARPDEPLRFDLRLIHKDGSVRYTESVARNQLGVPGIEGMVLSTRDVTERRRSEESLQAAHERLQSATEGAAAGVWDADLRTQKMTWDSRLRQQYALDVTEPDPDLSTWLDRVHVDDRAPVREKQLAAMRGEVERFDAEFRVPTPGGAERWFRSFGKIFRDQDGVALRATGINIDITDKKRLGEDKARAEAAVLASARRFRVMIENAADVIAITDAGGVMTYISPSLQVITGYSPEETLGRSVFDFVDPASVDDFKVNFTELVQ